MQLRDRVALITGGAGGIGSAIAGGLVAAGATVVLTDLERAAAERTADAIGSDRVTADALDVTDPEAANRVVRATVDVHGRLDVLFYAAGHTALTHALSVTPEEWETVIRVNLSGAFYCAQAAARVMAKQSSGSIVLVSSQLAEVARPKGAPYVASKGGLRSLAQALAVDLARYHVRVNCLGPGTTVTPMTQARYDDPEVRAGWERRIPLERAAVPADMVGAALFLASDDSAYVTGTSLYVDGGYLAW